MYHRRRIQSRQIHKCKEARDRKSRKIRRNKKMVKQVKGNWTLRQHLERKPRANQHHLPPPTRRLSRTKTCPLCPQNHHQLRQRKMTDGRQYGKKLRKPSISTIGSQAQHNGQILVFLNPVRQALMLPSLPRQLHLPLLLQLATTQQSTATTIQLLGTRSPVLQNQSLVRQ